MNPITVRKLPPGVAKLVKDKARREKLSLNRAIVQLLEQATGVRALPKTAVHHDLDKFCGTWSRQEADAFDEVLRSQRQVEPDEGK